MTRPLDPRGSRDSVSRGPLSVSGDGGSAGAARPLEGVRVVVTRPPHQAEGLARLLEARGAEPVLFPTIRIAPAADPEPLRRAAREAEGYDWIVFTSVNGVAAFEHAREEAGLGAPPAPPEGPSVCAIGPATAEAAEEAGLVVRLVPERYVAEAVLEAMAAADDLSGRRVLLPRAARAREVLPEGLRELGAEVDVVEAYRTEGVEEGGSEAGEATDRGARGPDARELRRRLDAGEIDWVTFTASSTVRSWHETMGAELGRARAAAIGPITARTAEGLGIPVAVVATEYTMEGLVEGLEGLERPERPPTRCP